MRLIGASPFFKTLNQAEDLERISLKNVDLKYDTSQPPSTQ